jgi:uncharacterized protein YgiM (DUF1202 family)
VAVSLRQSIVIALTIVFGCLATLAPAQTSSFAPGERITVVTDKVKVRDGAGLSFNTLGTQDNGAMGTILADSGGLVDGYLWLQIDYDNGADGWSAMGDANETFLEKVVVSTQQNSSTPTVTPSSTERTGRYDKVSGSDGFLELSEDGTFFITEDSESYSGT